jgi:ligand-binding SRPBCC domain-containing protein
VTILENSVVIEAPPSAVWAVLAELDGLARYDPAIALSEVESSEASGVGASRRCTLKAGGWFRERVTTWEAQRRLAFELYECTLPVRRLQHRYTLTGEGNGTRVEQRMEYELKFGLVGALLDIVAVRRKWDLGIKVFLDGLKKEVEASAAASQAASRAALVSSASHS